MQAQIRIGCLQGDRPAVRVSALASPSTIPVTRPGLVPRPFIAPSARQSTSQKPLALTASAAIAAAAPLEGSDGPASTNNKGQLFVCYANGTNTQNYGWYS